MGSTEFHADLQTIRLRLLDSLLMGLAALGFPAYALNFGSMVHLGFWRPLGVVTAGYGLLVLAAFVRRVGFPVRASVLLLALFALSANAFARFGLAGAGPMLAVAVAVLATVLFGLRMGLIAAAVGVVILGLEAFALVRGVLTLDPQVAATFCTSGPLTAGLAVMGVVALVLVIGPGLLQRHLLRSLERLERARGDLTREMEARERLAAEASMLSEQLHQAQRMETVGQLAAGVAHDFNNVLTVVRGNAELALGVGDGGAQVGEFLRGILRGVDRASELTGRLLAFSRQKVVATGPVSLHASLRDVEPMLRRLIGDDIVLTLDLGACTDVIRGDRNQLELALMNLVLNARDAMPTGGRLIIRSLSPPCDRARVRVEVEDSGVGMDEATCRRAFEPFFTTKAPGRGTGLGLTMVYNIMRQHGGTVSVRSSLGLGTVFALEFDTTDIAPEQVAAAVPEGDLPRGNETVLLVEDDAMVRETTAAILTELGYRVIEAGDGEEALARFAACERVDVLLTDIVMPGMSGREVAEALMARAPGLKVLYTSGYTEDDVLRRGVECERMHFLAKPFTPRQVGMLLRKALGTCG
jgi:signal transduction histidine kinase/CheY-like chemotaxis protein